MSYLAWRAFHAIGFLSHEEVATGVCFGVLRDLINIQEAHASKDLLFFFDHRPYKRNEIFSEYKGNHPTTNDQDQDARYEVRNQIRRLKNDILPKLGYRNIFSQEGFESDDLIAAFVGEMDSEDESVIVSADHDLYQCLSDSVCMWNPRKVEGKPKTYTASAFTKEWGVFPIEWSSVLAIAGCNGDNVRGVLGVKEKTAIKYLKGLLKPGSKTYRNINASQELIARNLQLVKLPFPGTAIIKIQKDETSRAKWKAVMNELGIKSLEYV